MSCYRTWQEWTDPLANIGRIAENPAVYSDNYAPNPENVHLEVQEYVSLQTAAKDVLDSYKSLGRGDSTVDLLKIFLDRLPYEGQVALLLDIVAVGHADEGLRRLERHLVDAILRPMLLAGGNQPFVFLTGPNDSPLPEIAEFYTNSLDCLVRDDFQCLITSRFNLILAPAGRIEDLLHGSARPVHILPFALGYLDYQLSKLNWLKRRMWRTLHRYFPALKGKIDGTSINHHANMATMCLDVYELFGAGKVALTPLDTPNTYHFRQSSTDDFPKGMEANEIVQTREHSWIPLPNKEFFRTQCIISEIIEVSGYGPKILYGPQTYP